MASIGPGQVPQGRNAGHNYFAPAPHTTPTAPQFSGTSGRATPGQPRFAAQASAPRQPAQFTNQPPAPAYRAQGWQPVAAPRPQPQVFQAPPVTGQRVYEGILGRQAQQEEFLGDLKARHDQSVRAVAEGTALSVAAYLAIRALSPRARRAARRAAAAPPQYLTGQAWLDDLHARQDAGEA